MKELTLLYVEDNQIVRENFTMIFSKYFQNVIVTDNGKDALRLYEENNIDIAVLDISIPEINGLDVAKIIRNNNKKIELLIITGHSQREKLLEAINLHLFSYLVKPVKKDELIDVINRLIKKVSSQNIFSLAYDYNYDMGQEILRYKDTIIKISKHEVKLISFLCSHPDSHYSACQISKIFFEVKNEDDTRCNNIIQLISRFKKKMLNSYNTESFFIDNIYGLGYKINLK